MKLALLVLSILLFSCAHVTTPPYGIDREKIIETNEEIRDGFVNQNLEKILVFHHPEVEKILAWNDYQKGHADMESALSKLFENYILEFQGSADDMDSLEIFEETAVMVAKFSVHGMPKKEGLESFVFSGRTMIVYTRHEGSPTGWATLREMIIPSN